jgi:hypothetical protein
MDSKTTPSSNSPFKTIRGRRERSQEREGGEKPRKREPLSRLVAAPAVHGSSEKLEGPAMEALVRSWRERLWSFGERESEREKRNSERER